MQKSLAEGPLKGRDVREGSLEGFAVHEHFASSRVQSYTCRPVRNPSGHARKRRTSLGLRMFMGVSQANDVLEDEDKITMPIVNTPDDEQ